MADQNDNGLVGQPVIAVRLMAQDESKQWVPMQLREGGLSMETPGVKSVTGTVGVTASPTTGAVVVQANVDAASVTINGSNQIQRAALTGDVTASAGANATTIANDVVSDAKLRNSNGLSVIGRSANSTGDPADIVASNDHEVLRRSGTSLGFGQVNLAQSAAVTGVLDETNGGTGQSSITTGDTLYGSASNTLSKLAIGSTGYFQRVAAGIPSWGKLGLSNKISPSISGDQNDWSPTGLSTASVIRVTATGAGRTITGLSAGSDGDIIVIENIGSLFITLANESGSSSAANQFKLGSTSISLWTGDSVVLEYSSTDSRWRCVAKHVGVPVARAYRSSSQTISAGATTKVQLNAEAYDSHGWFDITTNNRFQPLLPGKYHVSWHCLMEPPSSGIAFPSYCYKNGSGAIRSIYSLSGGSADVASGGSGTLEMNGSTDYLEIYVTNGHGSSRNLYAGVSPGPYNFVTIDRMGD